MNGTGGHLGPQVIRRDDDFVVINLREPLVGMGKRARMLLGIEIWDQVAYLLKANGQPTYVHDVGKCTGAVVGAPYSTLMTLREVLRKRPDLLPLALEDVGLNDLQRLAGRRLSVKLEEGALPQHKTLGNYGTGDKFRPVAELMLRYLRTWNRRGFEYRHINPAEARRRLKQIEEIEVLLAKAKEDLGPRSHVAAYSAAPEKKRKEKKA